MHFSTITVFSLSALSVALPTAKRQNGASVLGNAVYNDISISGGTAGNAEAEALAIFVNVDTANPGNISKDDQDSLNQVNQVANNAETDAFNPAIKAASGDEATALQNGKIKNKVLKLEAAVLKLKAQQAQGSNVAAKLAEEQEKLDKNIALDKAAAGQPSTFLPFDAQITGVGPAIGDAPTGSKGAKKGKSAVVVFETDAADEADDVENAIDDEADDQADDEEDE
ncbi:hypothetical protein PMIN06_005247 [Paraphaeosphaeria minitans]|uniref:Small secreted protein n=1 Tax=Paraphaeosphaeria minitans TaxID=565426 RepID=A0A9P6KTT8_9PLEO|nr:hypothetical protein PMIN01_01857 [Paraphaeosphaeria minitans]